MKKVLHVGCGSATIAQMTDGFRAGDWDEIRFDINPQVRPDLVGTIRDMAAVADESVDAVYSSHNIEHVETHEVAGVLREFRRVLRPDGFLVVTCPDVEAVAAHVAAGRLAEPLYVSPAGPITALDILFGHNRSIARGESYMAHRTAFSRASLGQAMAEAGFASVGARRRPAHVDLWAIGTRSPIAADAMTELMRLFCRT